MADYPREVMPGLIVVLSGLNYPATKAQVIARAKERRADALTELALNAIPDTAYDNFAAVAAVTRWHGGGLRMGQTRINMAEDNNGWLVEIEAGGMDSRTVTARATSFDDAMAVARERYRLLFPVTEEAQAERDRWEPPAYEPSPPLAEPFEPVAQTPPPFDPGEPVGQTATLVTSGLIEAPLV